MKYYTIGEFASLINKTPQTIRNWDKQGLLKPAYISKGGIRHYSQEQVNSLCGLTKVTQQNKIVIGYCRVSSSKQKDDLKRQTDNVRTYMLAKGYRFKIIEDIGSGINYNKKGLNELLDLIISNQVEKIVILYKDRLIRFGYELIANICDKYGVEIEIIDNTARSEQEELTEDLIQIITIFSCRLQGRHAHKAKKIINELTELKNNAEEL